jgi:tetratricopeptide (TPR) repeat protein
LDYPEEYAELMLSIGLSKLQIDEVDSAITYIQESIRFYDTTERLDFETMLNAKNTLAMAKKASGETSAAITLYENILLGIRTLDTPSFKLHTAVLNNLAAIYKDEKNYEKADSLYRTSFEIHENVYGREHPQSIMLLQNIRNVAVNRDRIDQADSLSSSIFELKKGVYGAQSWQLAQSYNSYGTIQFIHGNFNVATEYVEQAHDIYSDVLGENHNWTINSRLLLAFCLINIQEKRKAKSYYESAASRIQNQIDSYDYFSRQHLQNNLSYALEHSQEDVSDLVEPVKKILDETASI